MATAKKRKTSTADKAHAAAPLAFLAGVLGLGGFEWLKSILVAVLVALAIRWAVIEPFRIPSGSMEPTFIGVPHILRGDRVFVNKFTYGLRYPLNGIRIPFTSRHLNYASDRIWRRRLPERWDIVVFKSTEDGAQHTTLVKRVVGLPGERIQIADGKVYADGAPLELPPDMPPVYYTSRGFGSEMRYGILPDDEYSLIPEDSYLLLGDNSAQSRDGRFFGWVPYERMLGPVSCIWMPVSRWRDFTGFSQTLWWQALVAFTGVLTVWRLFFGRSWRHERAGKTIHFFINRWAFGLPLPFTRILLAAWGQPRRGDLVVYAPPKNHKGAPKMLLGRVAGLPGERVFLDAGKLRADGEFVAHPAIANRNYGSPEGVGPYARSKGKEFSLVPERHIFILTESDDPQEHLDGRTLGWTPVKSLLGRATGVWWPPQRIGKGIQPPQPEKPE